VTHYLSTAHRVVILSIATDCHARSRCPLFLARPSGV